MKTLTYENALHKAAAYCSLSEKCPYDVFKKLHDWGVGNPDAQKIVDYLKKENYLNEERYCNAFVKDKVRFSKWGQQKIVYALRAKQLPADSISRAVKGINGDVHLENLKSLLQQKQHTIKYKNEQDKIAKLVRFATSRGFELDAVLRVLKINDSIL